MPATGLAAAGARVQRPASGRLRRCGRWWPGVDARLVLRAGKSALLIGGSANRDPEAFTDVDVFDVDRDRGEAQNLAFGYGIHRGLGVGLDRSRPRWNTRSRLAGVYLARAVGVVTSTGPKRV